MLLAAGAFNARGSPDEPQHDEPEPDPKFKGGVWAAVRAQQAQALEPEVFHLWPEHVAAERLFRAVETQFVYDEGVPRGLDYARVRASPAFRAIPRAERESVFADVCDMERAWINERLRIRAEAMRKR